MLVIFIWIKAQKKMFEAETWRWLAEGTEWGKCCPVLIKPITLPSFKRLRLLPVSAKPLAVAPASFASEDSDWPGHTLTGHKQSRQELFKVDLWRLRLGISVILLPCKVSSSRLAWKCNSRRCLYSANRFTLFGFIIHTDCSPEHHKPTENSNKGQVKLRNMVIWKN